MDTELKKNNIESDTLDILDNLMEDEEMGSKFYNFQCINLYAYIDYAVAQQLTTNAQLNQPIQHLINTPLELFESPYMARVFASNLQNKQLVAFAICVQDGVYDEFDLGLEEKITKDKERRSKEQIRKSVAVVRQLKQYKSDKNKKGKPYISYVVQNQNAIKQIFPL